MLLTGGPPCPVYSPHVTAAADTPMMKWIVLLALTLGMMGPTTARAVVIAECRDGSGLTFFADRCPPGVSQTGSRTLGAQRADPKTSELTRASAEAPVSLYRVKDCNACELAGLALRERAVPFTEIDVEAEPEGLAQLKARTGAARVPTVVVGKRVIPGLDLPALDAALVEAGYRPASLSSP